MFTCFGMVFAGHLRQVIFCAHMLRNVLNSHETDVTNQFSTSTDVERIHLDMHPAAMHSIFLLYYNNQ